LNGKDITVKARKALSPLWDKAHMQGRCWGRKSSANLYSGTNITIAHGNDLVSVSERDGQLIIHEFERKPGTKLGKQTRELLREAGLLK